MSWRRSINQVNITLLLGTTEPSQLTGDFPSLQVAIEALLWSTVPSSEDAAKWKKFQEKSSRCALEDTRQDLQEGAERSGPGARKPRGCREEPSSASATALPNAGDGLPAAGWEPEVTFHPEICPNPF